MTLTVKESLKTPTHTYSLMGTNRPTILHINNRVTDRNSVIVPRDEVIAACHITAADIPEELVREIKAAALEAAAHKWSTRRKRCSEYVTRELLHWAAKLRKANDE